MEAVPKLPMLWFALKSSPEGTSFGNLKKYIAECYQENADSYSKEVYALEQLRNMAMRPEKDVKGCATLKRYYAQLHSLANRFSHISDRNLFTFSWKDLYVNNVTEITDLRFEMAAVLFNIAALHTQVGASVSRVDIDGMKLACTHFQCAAWCFGELRDKYHGVNNGSDFMTPELLVFMQQVSFAQAQECILEKSLIDNRKPAIVAKVTAQIVNYYSSALAALLTGGDDGPIGQVIDSNVYNSLWKKYIKFKVCYLTSILFLYQGMQAEEQQKMGERVVLYQAAANKLEEAKKECKGMADQQEIYEALAFTADIVEAKRRAATNENEFIYHETVPELTDIPAVQGANLVNGISFSVTDPEVMGEDIFARLVPMKAHEASSLYSEEKAKILRKYGAKIEEKDNELNSFLNSLNVEHLNASEEKSNKIPQGIVDRCASLNAKTNAIPDLITSMSNLAEICADVETNLKEIKELLNEEDINEKQYQQKSGVHRSNAHFTELAREFQKYLEAHQKAGESNDTLRRAMELHVNNLRILSRPLQDIQSSVPKLSGEVNEDVFRDLKLLLNKVNEMKAQRAQFHASLRISINEDDITSQVIACGEEKDLNALFKKELEKHDKICALVDQNLTAQSNILSALTEAYAKCAPLLKTMADVKHKKENFFSSLAASYDVYEDLLAKSAKGLEFYKKLQGNVQKLLARVKAARDVQDEERQQRLKSSKKIKHSDRSATCLMESMKPSGPQLKDYLKSGKQVSTSESNYIPSIRPNPLGSEAPTTSTCVASTYYTPQHQTVNPNEPPPAYTASIQQYYDVNGYTNPIYQNPATNPVGFVNYDTHSYYQQQMQGSQYPNPSSVPNMPSNYPLGEQSHTTAQSTSFYQQYPLQNMASNPQQLDSQTNVVYQQNPASQVYPQSSQYAASQSDTQETYGQQMTYSQSGQISNVGVNQQITLGNYNQQQVQQPQISTNLSGYIQPSSSTQNLASTSVGQQVQQPQISTAIRGHSQQLSNNYSTPTIATGQQGVDQSTSMSGYSHSTSTSYSTEISNNYDMTIGYTNVVSQNIYNQQMPVSISTPSANYSQSVETATPYSQQMTANSVPVTSTTTVNLAATQSTGSGWAMTGLTNQMDNLNLQNSQMTSNYYPYQQESYGDQQTHLLQSTDSQYSYQQLNPAIPSTLVQGSNSCMQQGGSYSTHPGYVYNNLTGEYQYGSGYTVDTNIYSQYTNAIPNQSSNTTDTTNIANSGQTYLNQYSVTGPQQPVQQTTGSSNEGVTNDVSYYTPPYGYQSTNPTVTPTTNVSGSGVPQAANGALMNPTGITYMQSNSNNETQTTISGNYANSTSSTTAQDTTEENTTQPQQRNSESNTTKSAANNKSSPNKKQNKKSSNIDLLSDVDFSSTGTNITTPPLQPVIATKKSENQPPSHVPIPLESKPLSETPKEIATPDTIKSLETLTGPDRKSSCDNLSICSDLSSLDHSFDWDSISIQNEKTSQPSANKEKIPYKDPFEDPKTLKYFHKEVERYEKMIESLNIKMLNGNTPLVNKWKELQDLLVKDESKRTTSVGKLFPEKNRTNDCIPYDHARVILERSTDNYINAAYVKDLGSSCPTFILAQTPLQNTVNDFWSMIWSQKTRIVVCLHTPNEILDTFWPQDFNKEMHFDDFSVTLIKQFDLSHCIELNLKLTMNGADAILDLSLIQIKAWTKSSPAQILGIAQNILIAYKQRSQEFKSSSPLIMNCLTGSERSGIIALAISTILATQAKRPILINVVDVWYRICSQRKSALRDTNNLQLSMQIVLSNAHDVLNKRGIMTSYQMKNAQTVTLIEKEEVKDPLNDLDPLWKLKQK